MSRSIMFRAWHEGRKEWLHDGKPPCGGCNILGETIWAFGEWCRVPLEELNDVVVEQFTGLKDKDGRDIYEGDIVKSSVIINRITDGIFLVRWNAYLGNWALDWKGRHAEGLVTNPGARGLQNPYHDWDTDFAKLTGAKSAKLSVVGNIHENSELLKSS